MSKIARPIIALRNICHNETLSEETHAYSATLYVNGEPWGKVSNQGHGGPDDFTPSGNRDYRDIGFLNKVIAATYPPIEAYEMSLPESLEMICGGLVNDFLANRELTSKLRRNVVYKHDGKLWTHSLKGGPVELVASYVRSKHPDAVILNELPPKEAMKIWQETA
ncbi:MAG: hypothetical protein ACOVKC_00275 [Brevundimonas sp.]